MPAHMLPVRVNPQEDECLSSWFARLAHANGEKVQRLAFQIWGRGQRLVGLNDLDRGDRVDVLQPLAAMSRVPLAAVHGTTLRAYEGWLWEEFGTRGVRPWVRPIVDGSHRRRLFGQQACSLCLSEDPTPYFRRSWRLAMHCVCPKHTCMLIDRCERCSAPLVPHRGDVGSQSVRHSSRLVCCWNCGADLRAVTVTPASAAEVRHQENLLSVLLEGWGAVAGVPVHSVLFFGGLRMLWAFLDAPRWSRGLAVNPSPSPPKRYGSFEVLAVNQRTQLLLAAGAYLDNWPDRLIDDMRKHRISSSKLLHFWILGPLDSSPFWLWEPVHLQRDRSMYVPTDDEISQAISFVLRRDGRLRASEVCKTLNMRTRCNTRVSQAVVGRKRCPKTKTLAVVNRIG
jgi:hypothetical protein